MAFVRWSGIRPLLDALRRHCSRREATSACHDDLHEQHGAARTRRAGIGSAPRSGSRTTPPPRASTRRPGCSTGDSGYSTAYIGSSNLTHSAMVTGLEWNVRVSGVRNPDVVAKMSAVFESYWASGDFVPFDRDEFRERTAVTEPEQSLLLSPDRDRACGRFRNGCWSRSSSHARAGGTATCSSRRPAPARR